ncbi:MAG: tRNA pseudouridine(55) synthase TruB [Bacteroidetes bacterium]|nr:tRNA pseudouridine(55) synthase TruB [Bacteroidota bacterium]
MTKIDPTIFSDSYFLSGQLLIINKESGWTSFDAVNKIRGLLKKKTGIKRIKVGHAGTLDPLATGLLLICTGKATKNISGYQGMEKEYIATVKLGATTPSFDAETEVDRTYAVSHIDEAMIRDTLIRFTGTSEQIPPAYSAKNIDGVRAYKLARRGEEVRLEPHVITVREAELVGVNLPEFTVRFVCSSGTYIRSLARDLGIAMDSGGYLTQLTRIRIGEFLIEDSITVKNFEKMLFNM